MQKVKSHKATQYTVSLDGRLESGSAYDILRGIQRNARPSSKVRKMSLNDYESALINDADYSIPDQVLEFLRSQEYETQHDQALEYLAAMPSSGVVILTRE